MYRPLERPPKRVVPAALTPGARVRLPRLIARFAPHSPLPPLTESDMPRPRVLIEQWLPIDQIGAECMRERGASSALPPLYFLHVWWARRPLTVSRAAILASLLPAYPNGDPDIMPWPEKFIEQFPAFEDYKKWFLGLVGIMGNPAAARRLIEHEKTHGIRTPGNKYGYPRAFTRNLNDEQLTSLYELLEWTWGTREIRFCDPMAGGGSIPFEALRLGMTVYANELNAVAAVILRATLDYPARFGPTLAQEIAKYGERWSARVRERLASYYAPHTATPGGSLKGGVHLWARTVCCPATGKPVPLSPNWWLAKGNEPVAIKVTAPKSSDRCIFEVVRGRAACAAAQPDKGTIKKGTAISPWTGDVVDGEYIKAEARAGRMREQLFAVEEYNGRPDFRAPIAEDDGAYLRALSYFEKMRPAWEAANLIPSERRRSGRADWACEIYGAVAWSDTFTPRQLMAMATFVESLRVTVDEANAEVGRTLAEVIQVYLAFAIDKAADYNSRQCSWNAPRQAVRNTFARHDLGMRWSISEFDASRNLAPWVVNQVVDAYKGIASLAATPNKDLFGPSGTSAVERLHFSQGSSAALSAVPTGGVQLIVVDPPYYDNVNYAECSNFFYVWMKRTVGDIFPECFSGELANEDDEAVMNVARFKVAGKKAKQLAIADYENKMQAAFTEMHRILSQDGVLSVMFTHKEVDAWDTLGASLIRAGFTVGASWPVHTEAETSLHQAKKNAAASTILLVCRKRERSGEPVWWDDLKARVRETARQKAAEFERQGIKGVDLYISTFGPVLSIISENWPVLTSQTDPKTGDPLPLKPGEALDLAREEVINLRKQGLLLGRSVEFDPITDWYLMAWDAFRAEQFPADEARKLALALGLDLERDIIKEKRLVSKKSGTVVLAKPADRRKKHLVDPEAEAFPQLIDALHTAMLVYDEEGSRACQVFVDRQGLRTDSRVKALAQAMMQAIPTTRGKDGQFLRPEMTTLDALRVLFWDDLPGPKEEEPPKFDPQAVLFEAAEEEEEVEEDETDE